jgi:phosphoglycerate dehydrogenase-like enzyme
VDAFRDTLWGEDALVGRPAPYEILVLIRERTRLSASLIERLPALEFLALTGRNSGQVDTPTATARGILVTATDGSGVAAIEHTIGLLMAAVRRIPQEERAASSGVARVPLDTLFRESDVISLHLRLSDRTRGLVTGRHLALMKPTAYLINTQEAYHIFFRQVVENIETYLDGQLPPRALNPEALMRRGGGVSRQTPPWTG